MTDLCQVIELLAQQRVIIRIVVGHDPRLEASDQRHPVPDVVDGLRVYVADLQTGERVR
jgi:hypothetical protein